MTNVIVEGSATPCVQLRRGEQRTFVLTPSVQRKINKGYFIEIKRWEPDQASTPVVSKPPVVEEPVVESVTPEETPTDAPVEKDSDLGLSKGSGSRKS